MALALRKVWNEQQEARLHVYGTGSLQMVTWLFVSKIRHKGYELNRSADKQLKWKTTYWWRFESFSAFLSRISIFLNMKLKRETGSGCVYVCGSRWIVSVGKVGVSSFKRSENKTGNHLLVLARGRYKCLEFWGGEFTCYVHVCAQVRACTHKHVHTQCRECLSCLDKQRHEDCEPPVDVMRSGHWID